MESSPESYRTNGAQSHADRGVSLLSGRKKQRTRILSMPRFDSIFLLLSLASAMAFGQPGSGSTQSVQSFGDAGGRRSETAANLAADRFPGADPSAQINACELQAQANANVSDRGIVGGSVVCDARMLYGRQVMHSQITVLSKTVLLLPHYGQWIWSLSDGVSAGILQQGNSSLIGTAPGGGGGQFLLEPGSNFTRMLALYATAAVIPTEYSYVYASGFFAFSGEFPGAVFSHGVVYTRMLFDESRFERIMADNQYGDSWHVAGACCDTEFVQVQANSGNTGKTPLTVENGKNYVVVTEDGLQLDQPDDTAAKRHVVNGRTYTSFPIGSSSFSWRGTVNASGAGHSNIDIEPNNAEIDFPVLYAEVNGKDSTTPIIHNASSYPLRITGGGLSQSFGTRPVFSNPSAVDIVSTMWARPSTNYSSTTRSSNTGLANADIDAADATSPYFFAGQGQAGLALFTPNAVGWYLVFGGRHRLSGTFDIEGANAVMDITGSVVSNSYKSPYCLSVLGGTSQGGEGNQPVTEIAVWSPDGNQSSAMAVYVSDVSSKEPIAITFAGQGIDRRGIVRMPTRMSAPPPRSFSYTSVTMPAASLSTSLITSCPVYASGGIVMPDTTNGHVYILQMTGGVLTPHQVR